MNSIKPRLNTVLLIIMAALLAVSCGTSRYERAAGYLDAGEYEKGIEYYRDRYRNNIKRAVSDFEVHRYVFKMYEELGEMRQCMEHYRPLRATDKALDLYIDGLFHMFQGLFTTAASRFSEAAKLRPKEHIIYYDEGLAHIKSGKFFAANMALNNAIRHGRSFPHSYYELGMMYAFKRKEYETGALYIKRAIRRFSEFEQEAIADAKISLGRIYELMGLYRDAALVYDDVKSYSFEKLVYSADVGALYYHLGDTEGAKRFWRRGIALVGLNSSLGRQFFKRLYGDRGGFLDYTGVPMSYLISESQWGDERYMFASEEEYFFTNPAEPALMDQLTSRNLIDQSFRTEVWTVEHLGFMARRQSVRRQVQTRGVIGYLDFNTRQDEKLYISVRKDSRIFNHLGRRAGSVRERTSEERRFGAWEREYWYKRDVRLAYARSGSIQQVLELPLQHLYRVSLLDVSGDGNREIVAAGFDNDDKLVLFVFRRSGNTWVQASRIECSMDHSDNGFVFLNLDGRSDMELVRFDSRIAWADVYKWTDSGFTLKNDVFKDFARDFARRFGFFVAGYGHKGTVGADVLRMRQELYTVYRQYLPRAEAILR